MTAGKSFADEILDEYLDQGWTRDEPGRTLPFNQFRPDYTLTRGDEHLAVQIKQPGDDGPPIAEVRKLVEAQPNWRLEVKLQPPGRKEASPRVADGDVPSRLDLAAKLLDGNRGNDAFLMTWVATEATLRRVSAGLGAKHEADRIPDLFRIAYEGEMISLAELHKLQHGLALRNRVVHGYAVDLDETDARSFLDLAQTLAARTRSEFPTAA